MRYDTKRKIPLRSSCPTSRNFVRSMARRWSECNATCTMHLRVSTRCATSKKCHWPDTSHDERGDGNSDFHYHRHHRLVVNSAKEPGLVPGLFLYKKLSTGEVIWHLTANIVGEYYVGVS